MFQSFFEVLVTNHHKLFLFFFFAASQHNAVVLKSISGLKSSALGGWKDLGFCRATWLRIVSAGMVEG